MGLARAARNLTRTARANPMWALLGVLLAPFRFARHIVVVVLFSALFLLLMLAIWYSNSTRMACLPKRRQ